MLQTRIIGTPDREDELFDEMRWSKSTKPKRAKVINQEGNRDSSSSVAIKNFLDSLNRRYLTMVLKTGNRQTEAFFTV